MWSRAPGSEAHLVILCSPISLHFLFHQAFFRWGKTSPRSVLDLQQRLPYFKWHAESRREVLRGEEL